MSSLIGAKAGSSAIGQQRKLRVAFKSRTFDEWNLVTWELVRAQQFAQLPFLRAQGALRHQLGQLC